MTPTTRQFFLLPNTLWGRFVLWLLKRYLNRATYEVRVFGRGPIRAKLLAWDRARWARHQARTLAELREDRDRYTATGPDDIVMQALCDRIDDVASWTYEPPQRLSLAYPTLPLSCARRLGVYLNVRRPPRREP